MLYCIVKAKIIWFNLLFSTIQTGYWAQNCCYRWRYTVSLKLRSYLMYCFLQPKVVTELRTAVANDAIPVLFKLTNYLIASRFISSTRIQKIVWFSLISPPIGTICPSTGCVWVALHSLVLIIKKLGTVWAPLVFKVWGPIGFCTFWGLQTATGCCATSI